VGLAGFPSGDPSASPLQQQSNEKQQQQQPNEPQQQQQQKIYTTMTYRDV
jgi:hypothetical protein